MKNSTDIHCNITVLGKVQGVFFRASAQHKATELGLTGLVQNQNNGSVNIEVEGPRDKVDELVNWCKQGPTHARVDEVLVEFGPVQGFVSFEIA